MTVAFLGAGNMATAMIDGLIASGFTDIVATRRSAGALEALASVRPIQTTPDNIHAARNADIIFLCVKPGDIASLLTKLGDATKGKTLVSIAAGTTLATIRRHAHADATVARCMPNLPVAARAGVCGLLFDEGSRSDALESLLERLGTVLVVDSDDTLDSVTALAGSGPAFMYRIAEGLIDGGTAVGLSQEAARRLAAQVIAGAGASMIATGEAPATLRERVTSPNGTTSAGLQEMNSRNVAEIMRDTIVKAKARAQEMAEQTRGSK